MGLAQVVTFVRGRRKGEEDLDCVETASIGKALFISFPKLIKARSSELNETSSRGSPDINLQGIAGTIFDR